MYNACKNYLGNSPFILDFAIVVSSIRDRGFGWFRGHIFKCHEIYFQVSSIKKLALLTKDRKGHGAKTIALVSKKAYPICVFDSDFEKEDRNLSVRIERLKKRMESSQG
jgi:hypothetical protein